jgi:hypothetical protein
MANLLSNSFSSYELSQRELLAGSVLNGDQISVLQNELSQIAESRLNLDFTPDNPLKFAQDEAFLKGQMSIIRVMLLRSQESEQQLRNLTE